jgi:pimeloyl-ACP methyl ester carboxylesterase
VFVHGNGDSAALWYTTVWRFESNGYDRRLLSAMDFTHPTARSDDTKPQPNRSSTEDQKAELGAAVTGVLNASHQPKVILVGSSRGGNAIRNYIKFGGGKDTVAAAILCGTPNHGVLAIPQVAPGGEFNGAGPFLSRLNEGSEVYPGVPFTTIRSDKNDKYAQPTGEFLGMPGKPTNVTAAGPELKGATNIVIPNLDHRETAFHPTAFAAMFRAITGRDPKTLDVLPEQQPVLNGMVSGFADGAPTNLPLSGAKVTVYAVNSASGERQGPPAHRSTTGADGLWGPFESDPTAYYEFEVAASGYPTIHSYRSPFPRSSATIHFRLRPVDPKLQAAGSAVILIRPRGYLGHGRDVFTIDGKVPEGVGQGVPGNDSATMAFPASPSRPVPVVLNQEKLTVRTFPLAEGHVVFAEFHY